MKIEIDLTIEQQFKLKIYTEQTKSLPPEQTRILLVEIMRQNMIKDNVIKSWLRETK
jgi:Phycobilisome degradation protein nblA